MRRILARELPVTRHPLWHRTAVAAFILFILAALIFSNAGQALAADIYVAPTGVGTNSGRIDHPLDLATALSANSPAQPGDTIWLLGGTYIGTYKSYLQGTQTAPITVRQYPGARATLDGAGSPNTVLEVFGQWVVFWGFELTNSDPNRLSAQAGSWPTDLTRGAGIISWGLNLKFINLIFHDLNTGLALWSESVGSEVYGCLFYYNGWQGPDRAHGHAIYTQNQTDERLVRENIVFDQFDVGIHAFGSSVAFLNNITMEGNVAFDNGVLGLAGFSADLLLGGGVVAQNPVFRENFTYGGAQSNFGYSAGCVNGLVMNNYFVGSTPLILVNCVPVMAGNVFYNLQAAQWGWGGDNFRLQDYPSNLYYAQPPPTNFITVRPDIYEAGRGHVIVYNWQHQDTVQVDLSPIGLSPGDAFEVRDAQNFFGAPVVTGHYDGTPISIPMNGLTLDPPIGNVPVMPQHTSSEFGVFVVVRVVRVAQSPTVSMTSPTGGATYTAPATVPITVTATESGGTVASVAFFANGGSIGTSTTAPFSFTWTNVAAGSYTLTAVATDTLGRAGAASSGVSIAVNPAGGFTPTNVALAANGATAVASSSYGATYAAADAITGNRAGLNWGYGGGWAANVFPDWLEVDFAAAETIGEVDVFTVQDNHTAPSTPTPTMTFSQYGLQNFEVQYWTGSAWADVPGGAIVNNNLVWRQVTFAPLATSRIRIWVTQAAAGPLGSWSCITDVEAWTASGTPAQSPTVSMTSPTGGATYTAPATVPITVTATESGGTVASVAFFANGGSIGTSTTAPFSFTWTNVAAGSYTLTAVATDTLGRAGAASSGVSIAVNPAGGFTPTNVALAANGATAVASSSYGATYAAADAITGNRAGLNWGYGGGWAANVFPDWLEVDFAAAETIGEVDVFTVQDNHTAPSTPTPTMTFSQYGLQNFEVQYWTGSAWADVPGGAIVNNNLVWRQVTFAPLATSRIRIWVTQAAAGPLGSWSCITDVEAWTASGTPAQSPTASVESPLTRPTATPQGAPVTAALDQALGTDRGRRGRLTRP